ncbi:MAG: tRNA (guanosine(37)-N1)-methyltransferase TrmD [Chloroflexi bacterium RBG_16_56_11]|nr:MAG: tRNA (guanosine(37)-N1)-methyltransferase TrmD [Chloroflexi bacterium RBG_16_56_11]
MRIDILTLFPRMFEAPFSFGIFKRALDNGLVAMKTYNIRDYTHDKHHTADDYPYGGGAGMVLKPEPIFEAWEAIKANASSDRGEPRIVLLTPQGRPFSQSVARELARERHLVFICGHYEGVDERVREHLATDEISIGDYVLTGGEIPAMVVIDAVIRLLPGVLGSEESSRHDSHASGLLEYPQYTRPEEYRGWRVPEVLLSGNHGEIARWRREQIIRRTLERRPELLDKADLGLEDKKIVERLTSPTKAGHQAQSDRES